MAGFAKVPPGSEVAHLPKVLRSIHSILGCLDHLEKVSEIMLYSHVNTSHLSFVQKEVMIKISKDHTTCHCPYMQFFEVYMFNDRLNEAQYMYMMHPFI